jgi:hypothetical protein
MYELFILSQIRSDRHRPAAGGLDPLDDLLGGTCALGVVDHYQKNILRQPRSDGGPDTAGGAGHERSLLWFQDAHNRLRLRRR